MPEEASKVLVGPGVKRMVITKPIKNQVTIFTDPHIYNYKRNDLPC